MITNHMTFVFVKHTYACMYIHMISLFSDMEEIEFYNDLKQWRGICFLRWTKSKSGKLKWFMRTIFGSGCNIFNSGQKNSWLVAIPILEGQAAGACSVFVLLSISSHKVAKAVPRINIENLNQLNWNSSELPLCYLDTPSVERSEKISLRI